MRCSQPRPGLLCAVLALGLVLGAGAAAPLAAENHLAAEASPYLQEHARDPVDWYPWGAEAFAQATRQDRPVFLSIGYATCHWCRVMALESFEDREVADYLNQHFIAIKVDREELPQIDAYYSAFVEVSQGSAGWPLNVFCAPDRQPFFGTTYLSKEQLLKALHAVVTQWSNDRPVLIAHGREVVALLAQSTTPQGAPQDLQRLNQQALAQLTRQFDDLDAGFGEAPKFPQPPLLAYLLRPEAAVSPDPNPNPSTRAMVQRTLQALLRGGIHDQLDGGFHRYAIDAAWRVPHFEKMLLEQALLARTLLRGGRLFHDPEMRQAALQTLHYAQEHLGAPAGGYFTAEDADSLVAPAVAGSSEREGAYYVWSDVQITDALAGLGAQSALAGALVRMMFGIHADGNVPEGLDARGDLAQMNVLHLVKSAQACAQTLHLTPAQASDLDQRCRTALLAARQRRPPPACEHQILVGWNGLMVGTLALADADACADGGLPQARAAAEATVRLIRAHAWDETRGLSRVVRASASTAWHEASALDYAELTQGLILLHQVDGDTGHLAWALVLQDRLDHDFLDPVSGAYFDSALAAKPEVPARLRSDQDGAEPAANSIIADNLVYLSRATGDAALSARLHALLTAYRSILADHPENMPMMLGAMNRAAASDRHVVITVPAAAAAAGAGTAATAPAESAPHAIDAQVQALLAATWSSGDEDLVRVVVPSPLGAYPRLGRYPQLQVPALPGAVTASYCSGTACLPPTRDPQVLQGQLTPR
jgi:uncharacterized protein YyaL (SSP411 family)